MPKITKKQTTYCKNNDKNKSHILSAFAFPLELLEHIFIILMPILLLFFSHLQDAISSTRQSLFIAIKQ